MGIRFHCPNGHKLNVKAFLAGKKGVCPDCGTKVRIPNRSEPELDSGIGKAATPQATKQPAANGTPAYSPTATAARSIVMTPPAPTPLPQIPLQPAVLPGLVASVAPVHPLTPFASNVPRGAALAPAPVAMPVAPMPHPAARPYAAPAVPMPPPPPPPAPAGMPPAVRDPLAESPLATWFVRPPSGSQFGPARGEVMRKWIAEGRVTADSLVWREGWTDWLTASEVFPSLGKPAPLFSTSPSSAKSTTSVPMPKKKGNGGIGVAILVLLAVICVILVGVLAVVLSGSLSST